MPSNSRGIEGLPDYCARCGRIIPPNQVKVYDAKLWHPCCLETHRADVYQTRMAPIVKRDQEYHDALVKQYGLWRNK